MSSIGLAFDVIGVLAYVGAFALGLLNYRDSDLESGFWSNFTFAAGVAILWTGSQSLEGIGFTFGGESDFVVLMLLAATTGVFAVSATATFGIVDDLKSEQASATEARERANEARREAETAQEEAEAARQEAEAFNEALERKARDYGAVMERAAQGDLTGRMDPESPSDAMVRIGEGFNEMARELEGTVLKIQQFADEVAASSQQVTASTEEIRTASQEVSESVQEISHGANSQNDNLQTVSDEMTSLSGTIEEIASSAAEVASTSERAAESGEAGGESAADAIAEMNGLEEKTDETIAEVESLDDEMDRIGDIVDLIRKIAEQTNLLALNASIEAASAGEAGEGFAVVADEIKDLAGEAETATQQIEALIGDVQSSTETTVDDMREMGRRVSTGMGTVEEALSSLEDIVARIEEANDGVQEIDSATDQQAESTQEVVSMVERAASTSEQTNAEAESVSAAAEQQAASVREVSQSATELTNRAEDLAELLTQFEVGDGARAPAVETDTSGPVATADGGRPRNGPAE